MHTGASPQENDLDKLEYYKEKLHILQQNMHAIEEAIDAVEDSNRRSVLRLRYIDGLSWDLVADRMGYSLSWVKDVHAEALGEFQ